MRHGCQTADDRRRTSRLGSAGPEPLRSFLASYGSHDAGAEHELLVILNGLDAPGASARLELLAELEGTAHRLVELERPVLDLEAYRQTAARVGRTSPFAS